MRFFLSFMGKAPALAGAFLISINSIAVGVELVRQLYFVLFHGVRSVGGLTGFWRRSPPSWPTATGFSDYKRIRTYFVDDA